MKKLITSIVGIAIIALAGCVHQDQQRYSYTYPQTPQYQPQQPVYTPTPTPRPVAPKPTPRPVVKPKPTPKPTPAPAAPVIRLQRPVLFGASWCTPCKQLHAKLHAQGKKVKEHYDYYDIDTEMGNFAPADLNAKAKAYIDAKGIPASMDIYGNMSHGNSML